MLIAKKILFEHCGLSAEMKIWEKHKSKGAKNTAVSKKDTRKVKVKITSSIPHKTHFSLSPSHFETRSEEEMEKKVELLASVATALAR